jgi:hypothetical protein
VTTAAAPGLSGLTGLGLLVVLIGSMWMTLAPQWPSFRERRMALGWLTWGLTRGAMAALIGAVTRYAPARLAWILPGASLTFGGPGAAAGPLLPRVLSPEAGASGGLAAVAVLWLADLTVFTLLARSHGEEGHAAWSWAASPLVWFLWAPNGQPVMIAAAGITLAWWFERQGRGAIAGLSLAFAMLAGTPLAVLPAIAVAAGSRQRAALVACASLPAAAVFAFARGGHIEDVFSGPAVGPTAWRLPAVLAGWDPGAIAWVPFGLVLIVGTVLLWRRAGDTADQGTWAWAAFAALGHAIAPASVLAWAPLLSVWASRDPDRRGWWLVYGAALPVAWLLDAGALTVPGSPWRSVAACAIGAVVLLSAWPLRAALRPPTRESATTAI